MTLPSNRSLGAPALWCALLGTIVSSAAVYAADAPAPATSISFKPDAATAVDDLRVFVLLAVLLVVAFVTIWLLKRRFPALSYLGNETNKRLRLIEARPLSPKLTVYLIALDGKELLLAHSGEQVTWLSGPEKALSAGSQG